MPRRKRADRATGQAHPADGEPAERREPTDAVASPSSAVADQPTEDSPPGAPPPPSSLGSLPATEAGGQTAPLAAHLTVIVEAAERSGEELRRHTEQRARERIAEADRAAEQRVTAAEQEARELLDAAQREAERTTSEALATVAAIHGEAAERQREVQAQLDQARTEAERVITAAREQSERQAQHVRTRAREDARETVGVAHAAARDVLSEGTELSDNLRELSGSLRNNAERLLRDVRHAHESITSQLHAALPPGGDGDSSD